MVKRGKRKTDVSRMFHISRNTLELWLKREEQTVDRRLSSHHPQQTTAIAIKSQTGKDFVSLFNSMGIISKSKCAHCGETT
ncbi:hypothetical protein GNF10_30010 [Nostoc sp. UCD121]|uniref:hypothetical protein n=1 Tax=unclassified Nostoc TaxID=2593658 RepID=UPI001628C9AF|nr:hypothetical protein [Nostoc sp. UCD121]MBC1280068.1 hypothetical protein [Nostoc sp. UCD121]MBC1298263.1 hypothetical protein [Nostoc sp. UCD122]